MASQHDDKRLQIITLKQFTNKTQKEIADDLHVTQSMVSKVLRDYDEMQTHKSAYGNRGRPSKFNEHDLHQIQRAVVANPRAPAKDIQQNLGMGNNGTVRSF